MARVVSALILLFGVIFFLVFWFENSAGFTYEIPVRYNIIVYSVGPVNIPVWALMILCFICGIILVFLAELVIWIKIQSKISRQNKTIKRMEKELRTLRALPFSDSGEMDKITKLD